MKERSKKLTREGVLREIGTYRGGTESEEVHEHADVESIAHSSVFVTEEVRETEGERDVDVLGNHTVKGPTSILES
jgi:hypothetical protein